MEICWSFLQNMNLGGGGGGGNYNVWKKINPKGDLSGRGLGSI